MRVPVWRLAAQGAAWLVSLGLCVAGAFLLLFDMRHAEVLLAPGALALLVQGGLMVITNRGLSDRALISSRAGGVAASAVGLAALSGGIELLDRAGPWLLGLAPVGVVSLAAARAMWHADELRFTTRSGTDIEPMAGALVIAVMGVAALVAAAGEVL